MITVLYLREKPKRGQASYLSVKRIYLFGFILIFKRIQEAY